ncbi:hypothetical protein QYF61_018358 [Mycteria americana]|uniref:Fringe-like glycosyltransferase domain-containing protein n=1 Tax=Mycteria americana TaxID=33587 RepID=A0AAN7NQE5_MYCAM|nr:hypothetical protein QYF61_018358 [Mycteria americana]
MSALPGEITRGVGGSERQRTSMVDHHEKEKKEERRGGRQRPSQQRRNQNGSFCCPNKFLAPELTSPSLLLSHHPSWQVTLSYGVFEDKLNVIELSGPFSPQEDPSSLDSKKAGNSSLSLLELYRIQQPWLSAKASLWLVLDREKNGAYPEALTRRDRVGKEGRAYRINRTVLSHLRRGNKMVFGTVRGRVQEQRSLSTQKYHEATDLKDG